MKFLLAALLLLVPVSGRAADSVLLRSEVSPKEIHIGDPVSVSITVFTSTSIAAAPIEFPKTLGDFELLGQRSDPPRTQANRITLAHHLTVTTFSTGTVTLPAIPLYFKNPDGSLAEAKTDEVAITVKSLLAEKGDEGNLRPLKGLFNVRSWWWLWTLLGLIAAGLVAWLIIRARSLRAGAVPAGPPEPTLSPEEEAQQALVALEQSSLIADGQYKEFYSGLAGILRRYVARRYRISATEMTSAELIAAFRKAGVPTEPAYTGRAFLDNADLVKFAKWTPEGQELLDDVSRLRSFIEQTTPKPVATEPAPASEEPMPL